MYPTSYYTDLAILTAKNDIEILETSKDCLPEEFYEAEMKKLKDGLCRLIMMKHEPKHFKREKKRFWWNI